MPTFEELAKASPAFQREAKELNNRLDDYGASRLGQVSHRSTYRFPPKGSRGWSAEDIDSLAQDTTALTHKALWNESSIINGKKDRYYGGFMSTILNGLFDLYDSQAVNSLSNSIIAGLINSGRVERVGPSKGSRMTLWVRPPQDKFSPATTYTHQKTGVTKKKKEPWKPSQRAAAEIEQQAEKAVELAGEVTTTYDIDLIPTPDPNPESVMVYVETLTTSFKAMKVSLDEANAQIAEFEKEKSERAEWVEVINRINKEKAG